MTSGINPEDLQSRWSQVLRQSTKSTFTWACPSCNDRRIFHDDGALEAHVQREHPEFFSGALTDEQVAKRKEELRTQAREKRRTGVDATPVKGPQGLLSSFSRPDDPLGHEGALSGGDEDERSIGRRQVKEIGDIKQLSLGRQDDAPAKGRSLDPSDTAQLSPLGPRKRAAGGEPGTTDQVPQSTALVADSRARRSKARSGPIHSGEEVALVSPDPDFRRDPINPNEEPVPRQSTQSGKRLYDHTVDGPLSRPAVEQRLAGPSAPWSRSKKGSSRRKDTKPSARDPRATPPLRQRPSQSSHHSPSPPPSEQNIKWSGKSRRTFAGSSVDIDPALIMQPETRPISQEQLVQEVKGIYAGLVMVEAKCVEVDNKQAAASQAAEPGKQPKLSDEQWQALISLHRTLLHEHHDFFLASQHPSASPALRRLASKYAMPARMWRHGIHAFLELLRHRLPGSLDHMLYFIYLAYSMMALLYETVPAFEDTWIECLGDLGRYRMAIEDDDIRDREIWTGVAQFWYSKAADKNPNVGRLYHHLAILARPNNLKQLYYYTRSLTCVQSFMSARESILTLFDPILSGTAQPHAKSFPIDTDFIKVHGYLFTGVNMESFGSTIGRFLEALDEHIDRVSKRWKERGTFIAVTNIAALFGYGSPYGLSRTPFIPSVPSKTRIEETAKPGMVITQGPTPPDPGALEASEASQLERSQAVSSIASDISKEQAKSDSVDPPVLQHIEHASRILFPSFAIALDRHADENVMPHVHVTLVFLRNLVRDKQAIQLVEKAVPWEEIIAYLNSLPRPEEMNSWEEGLSFPPPEDAEEPRRPLPEDYAMRGQIWSQQYFPTDWFIKALDDDDERSLELPSMVLNRGLINPAQENQWIRYRKETRDFEIAPYVVQLIEDAERSTYELDTRTPPTEEDEDVEMSGVGADVAHPPLKHNRDSLPELQSFSKQDFVPPRDQLSAPTEDL
ncbi:MAG: hypothetical protein M1833_001730 [Piccolia ochrophora]|nr:MAG: hypothetical protein M1833_001730 [Piccolia ochrophora]